MVERQNNFGELHRPKMVIFMKPIFKMCQWFGTFPIEINVSEYQRSLYVDRTSFNYLRTLVILVFATLYIVFHIFSLTTTILGGVTMVEIFALSVYLQSSFISYFATILLLINPKSITDLYTKNLRAVEENKKLTLSSNVYRFRLLCLWMYGTFTLFSTVLVAGHSIRYPTYPGYLLHYLHPNSTRIVNGTIMDIGYQELNTFSIIFAGFQTLVEIWITFWKWCGLMLIDVSLALYGYIITKKLEVAMNQEFHSDDAAEPTDETTMVVSIIIRDEINQKNNSALESSKHFVKANKMTAVKSSKSNMKKTLFLLDSTQKIAQLVNDVNNAIGPLLLINFSQLILMICILVFLPLKFFDKMDIVYTYLFLGNAVIFVLRLVLLTFCLGDVYPTGVEANMRIAKYITSECQELNPQHFASILGHLSVYSANPICFTAWGFFPITRGTLLGTLSVISTYILVLVQLK